MDDLKKVVAGNIIKLRTSMNLTQAQLGEKLNYSDKSISKWERGESVPDVFVLKTIADMAGVTVDYIITPHDPDEEVQIEAKGPRYSRRFITLTVLAGIVVILTLVSAVDYLVRNASVLSDK